MLHALVLLICSLAPTGDDTQVLLTKTQALQVVFPGCERALEVRRVLSDEEKGALEKALHRTLEEKGFLV